MFRVILPFFLNFVSLFIAVEFASLTLRLIGGQKVPIDGLPSGFILTLSALALVIALPAWTSPIEPREPTSPLGRVIGASVRIGIWLPAAVMAGLIAGWADNLTKSAETPYSTQDVLSVAIGWSIDLLAIFISVALVRQFLNMSPEDLSIITRRLLFLFPSRRSDTPAGASWERNCGKAARVLALCVTSWGVIPLLIMLFVYSARTIITT